MANSKVSIRVLSTENASGLLTMMSKDHLSNTGELLEYLSSYDAKANSNCQRHRLLLIEDLAPAIIDSLGSHFNLPPQSFFHHLYRSSYRLELEDVLHYGFLDTLKYNARSRLTYLMLKTLEGSISMPT